MRLVVDESVSESQLQRVLAFLGPIPDQVPVPSGASDQHIFHELLGEDTVLATRDRPFHNGVLARGLKSVFVSANHLTNRPLRGIRPLTFGDYRPSQGHPPAVDLRYYLLPESEKQIKKLRTQRRRIRNHFGGLEALEHNALTVCWTETKKGTLIGLRLRVASRVGKKALDASERYLLEPPGEPPLKAYCHDLVMPVHLLLNNIKTVVYVDGPGRDDVEPTTFLARLEACYPALEYVRSTKGKFVEKLRRKLVDLKRGKSNEVRTGDFAEMERRAEPRRGAYAVVLHQGRVAVVRSRCGYLMLPGGGLELGESPEEALLREVEEECGFRIEVGDFLGEEEEHVRLTDDRRLFKHGRFYRARMVEEATRNPEFEVLWMEPEEAHQLLFEESQARAVLRAL